MNHESPIGATMSTTRLRLGPGPSACLVNLRRRLVSTKGQTWQLRYRPSHPNEAGPIP
jgi:hypothetical protein